MEALPQAVSTWVLENHRRVPAECAELVATLDRLAPVWRELRSVLNGLNRVLGDRYRQLDAARTPATGREVGRSEP